MQAKVAEETVPRLPVIMEEGQEQLTPADEAATEASCSQSTKPRLPENFNSLLARPRLKAVKQVCIFKTEVDLSLSCFTVQYLSCLNLLCNIHKHR